jgi:hypothetical protein
MAYNITTGITTSTAISPFVHIYMRRKKLSLFAFGLICLCLAACAPQSSPPMPIKTAARTHAPTLDDFWDGNAHFEVETEDTGLPMGESDTIVLQDGTWRSYLHASHQSLGVVDQCGAPVEFPGCLITFTSTDHGKSFTPAVNEEGVLMCQMACAQCPCDSRRDQIDQQQYPRVASLAGGEAESRADQWVLTYEYRANTIVRRSRDGLTWSPPAELPLTGIWQSWLMPCRPEGAIGLHPYAPAAYNCLVGSPPGIFIDQHTSPPQLYIFVGLGQNPSGIGCYRGPLDGPTSLMRACDHNPLFTGATEYGPIGNETISHNQSTNVNRYFDFRTISSADVIGVGNHTYLFYEGVRGPGLGDPGDTQFLLGLARSTTPAIDGAWELYPANPILLDLPGNVGVGHADVVVADGATYLYTTLDGMKRSRLRLAWN